MVGKTLAVPNTTPNQDASTWWLCRKGTNIVDITPKLSDAELAEVNGGVISDEIMGYLDLIPKYHADNLRKILEVDGELQFLNRFWPILSAYQKGNQSSVVRMAYQRLSLHQGPNNGSR